MTGRLHHLDAWRSAAYDAVIVGGGPAGLSAALVLGLANKRVLMVDDDRPANAVSQGVGGLLGHDRVKPADLRESGRPLAFQGGGPAAVRSALVLAGWSNDVVLCTDGAPDPGGALLADAGVRVRTEPIARLAGSDGRLEAIEFSRGPGERREALFVNTRRDQPNGLAAALGCELTAAGTIVTDADGRTNVAGVYAAGDAATAHSRSVANAIGAGSRVAYAVALERLAPVIAAAA